MYFDWNEEKNEKLKAERDISFEEVVDALNEGGFLEILDHPNQKKHSNQKILIVKIESYAYQVPFVFDKEKIFFKTIYPSRKATKKYLVGKKTK